MPEVREALTILYQKPYGDRYLRGRNILSVGFLESPNFVEGLAGWQITEETVEFNSGTFRGALIAGSIHIPDQDTTANSFHVATDGSGWVGATTANRANALFKWTKAGVITAESGTIGGWTLSSTSLIGGSGGTTIGLIPGTGIHLGNAAFGSSPFRVTNAGFLTATNGTIGGWALTSTSLIGGSGSSTISLAPGVGIHLGNATFGSAPFRVTGTGVLTATNATITGVIKATSGFIGGTTDGWEISAGLIKSTSGDIELKGTATSHIKAISAADNTDYIQMTAASNTPRLDLYLNNVLRVSVRNNFIDFYSSDATNVGWISGAKSGAIRMIAISTDRFQVLEFDGSGGAELFSGDHILSEIGGTTQRARIGIDLTNNLEILSWDGHIEMWPSLDTGTKRVFYGGAILPVTAGGYDCGNATWYWDDLSFKTLSDRGCLGWFDEGVELQDGSLVSDLEALQQIQKHPILKTVYGVPRFDYSTMPKSVYKPAPIATEDIYESNQNGKKKILYRKGEKAGEDGAELTALVSIMIGAIKELDNKINNIK